MRRILRSLIVTLIVFTFIVPGFSHADQVHRVVSGDTLYSIAKKFGVEMTALTNHNPFLKNPNILYPKQVLIIPEKAQVDTYQVQSGDTLYKISQKLGVPLVAIAEANTLSNMNRVNIGQILIIPSNTDSKYNVKPGDTLFTISQNLGVSMTTLAEENDLVNLNRLYVGQALVIPSKPIQSTTPLGYHPLAQKYPDTFFTKGANSNRNISLTFDDGPDEIYTAQILDILKKYHVRATFYLLGSKVGKNSELVKRMVQEGHIIANHTFTHPDMRKITSDQVVKEMIDTQNVIEKVSGLRTAIMRPPYGFANDAVIEQLKGLDYKAIHWTIDPKDWESTITVDQILIRTLPYINGDDAIVLMHDSSGDRSSTVKALPELIETLQKNGFVFVTTDKMLGIKAYK